MHLDKASLAYHRERVDKRVREIRERSQAIDAQKKRKTASPIKLPAVLQNPPEPDAPHHHAVENPERLQLKSILKLPPLLSLPPSTRRVRVNMDSDVEEIPMPQTRESRRKDGHGSKGNKANKHTKSGQSLRSDDEELPKELRDALRHRSKKDGMKHFGFGKGIDGQPGITRCVLKFREPPQSNPRALCFQFPSNFLSHRYILDIVKEKIHFVPDAGVSSILFVDRNVIHGARGLDNRWVITLTSQAARDELQRVGMCVFNRRIPLRRYDDVIAEEYKEYEEYIALQNRLFPPPDDVSEEVPRQEEEKVHKKKHRRRRHKSEKAAEATVAEEELVAPPVVRGTHSPFAWHSNSPPRVLSALRMRTPLSEPEPPATPKCSFKGYIPGVNQALMGDLDAFDDVTEGDVAPADIEIEVKSASTTRGRHSRLYMK